MIFLKLTDTVSDRPSPPIGFIEKWSISSLVQVYLPNNCSFLYHLISQPYHLNSVNYEGFSYVGMAGLIISVFIIIRAIYFLRNKNSFLYKMPKELTVSLMAAFLLFVISTGFPFNGPLRFLLDYLGRLRDFRFLGRIAWVFYNVLLIYGAVLFNNLYVYLKAQKYSWSLIPVTVLACFCFVDGVSFIFNIAKGCSGMENKFLKKDSHLNDLQFDSYQSLLALPYYNIGSDKFDGYQDLDLTVKSMVLSYQSRLPLMDVQLSRTSFNNTASLVRLFANPILPLSDVVAQFNIKPILLLVHNDVQLSPVEKFYISNSKYLKHLAPNYDLYSLPVGAFLKSHKQSKDTALCYLNHLISAPMYTNTGAVAVSKRISVFCKKPCMMLDTLKLSGKYNEIGFQDSLPSDWSGKDCLVSWWLKLYPHDLRIVDAWLDILNKNGKD
jgi:hypothetical protein